MAVFRVNNATLLGGVVCAQWVPNTVYELGARVVCRTAYGTVARRAWVYECTTAGTSHATTEPTWPISGTVGDGTVTWTFRNPNDGNWNNASCILAYILNHSAIAAGDFVYIHNTHAEAVLISATARYIVKGSGTKNNLISILCVNKATNALSHGAVVEDLQTSTSYPTDFTLFGFSYGVQYKSGTHMRVAGNWEITTALGQKIASIVAARYFGINTLGTDRALVLFGDIEFLAATAWLTCAHPFLWRGGAVIAAGGVANLVRADAAYGHSRFTIRNVDLSAVGNNNMVSPISTSFILDAIFTRCKMPGSYTPFSGTLTAYDFSRISFHHCSDGNKTYAFNDVSYCGTNMDEIVIVRTGGASDGTTPQSIKMVSSANVREQLIALSCPPIFGWTSSITSKTFTIEFVYDSVTALKNNEIWMELEYPANNTDALGVVTSSRCLPLATPVDTAASAETWTTTGLTNPNRRKLSVTVTPGKAGPITARVYLAKASTTVYVDLKITES